MSKFWERDDFKPTCVKGEADYDPSDDFHFGDRVNCDNCNGSIEDFGEMGYHDPEEGIEYCDGCIEDYKEGTANE